jgi:outer membrane protein
MSLSIARCTLTSTTVAILALLAPFTARADDAPRAVVGAGVAYAPEYSGGDKMWLAPALYADYSFGNGFFASTTRGIGYATTFDSIELSAALGYRNGRGESRKYNGRYGSDFLKGMGEIDGTATINLGAATTVGQVHFGVGAHIAGSGDGKGNTYTLQAAYPLYSSAQNQVELSGIASYGDRKHTQTWYGVSAAQHAASGFRAYEAKSGFESVGVNVAWNHVIDKHWSVRTAVGLKTLVGDAADSPIVQKKTAPMLVSTINYAF